MLVRRAASTLLQKRDAVARRARGVAAHCATVHAVDGHATGFVMMPAGRGQSGGGGLRRYTSVMNAVHAGAARTPPCALALILSGLSSPIHTPATRSLV